MEKSNRGKAFGLLFLTFFFWGSVYVAGKLISDQIPPILLACLRCCVAMLPLSLMNRKNRNVPVEAEDRKYFLLIGALGYFMTIVLVQVGISLTGAAIASLVNSLTPVSVMVMAALILKEKITPVKCLCLVLAITGTVVVTSGTQGKGELAGILLVLLSVLCWGIASIYMRRLTAKYPAIMVTTYSMGLSLVFHIPVGCYVAATSEIHITPLCVLTVLYLGLIGSGFTQFTWTKSLSMLPASTCSLFYPLQAVFAAVLGAIILQETFKPSFFLGMLLITVDVVLNVWETKRLTR